MRPRSRVYLSSSVTPTGALASCPAMALLELLPLSLPNGLLKDRACTLVIGPSGGGLPILGESPEIGERALDGQRSAQHDIARIRDLAVAHGVQFVGRKPRRPAALAHDDHLVGAAEG